VPGMDYNAQFSPNGKQIVFTSERGGRGQSDIYLANIDGTGVRQLTNDPAVDDAATWSPEGTQIAFVSTRGPSYSPDGTRIVYRAWTTGSTLGLLILNLTNSTPQVLTNSWDNLPQWSPDGTALTRLTTIGANDAHAVWTPDGKILWSTGQSGFEDEAAIYENTFQPYGQTWEMNSDGTNPTSVD
jgi:Tol biopolymer transport system component